MSNCKIFKHLELLGPSLQHRLPVNLLCLLICLCWPGWLLADRGDRSVRTSEGRVKISLTFTHTSTSWSIAAVETEGNCQLLLLTLGTGDHVRICVSLSFPWVYKELIIFVDSSWRAHGLHGETWAKRDPDTGYTHEGQVRPASRGPQVEPRPSSPGGISQDADYTAQHIVAEVEPHNHRFLYKCTVREGSSLEPWYPGQP